MKFLGVWRVMSYVWPESDWKLMSALLCIIEIFGRIEDLHQLLIDYDLKVVILGEAAVSAFLPLIAIK